MKPKIKLAIILVGIVGVALLATGIFLYNKPHKNYARAKVEVSISAGELYDAFNKDEQNANEKYLGKIIAVNGTIINKTNNRNNSLSIFLFDDFSGVTCTFDSSYVATNQHQLQGLQVGQQVKIKGRCDGFLSDVRLSKCSIELDN